MSCERDNALKRFPPQTGYRWEYLYLSNGRLIDKETQREANKNWPSFNSVEEAEQYLQQHNIRATVVNQTPSVKVDLRKGYDEMAKVDSGTLYRKGSTIEQRMAPSAKGYSVEPFPVTIEKSGNTYFFYKIYPNILVLTRDAEKLQEMGYKTLVETRVDVDALYVYPQYRFEKRG
jgi:hypothetical protein